MKTNILFFSRGRGYGHAVTDMAIAEALAELDGEINIKFVSYATGTRAFAKAGRDVHDLGLAEKNGFIETLEMAYGLVGQIRPDVVVAHEEFAALVAAKLLGIPAIYLAAWLPRTGHTTADTLACASSVIVTGPPGVFPEPPTLSSRPIYVGPIFRRMKHSLDDRGRVRQALGLSSEAYVMLVIPGGSVAEKHSPIADIILDAFEAHSSREKHLYWISSQDEVTLRERTNAMAQVSILPYVNAIEEMMVAADVVLSRGTLGVTLDTATLGIPSISISPGTNAIDDMIVPRMHSNIALNANAINAEILSHYLSIVGDPEYRRQLRLNIPKDTGATLAATTLRTEIYRLKAMSDQARP